MLKEKAVELRSATGIAHLPLTALAYFRKAAIPLNSEAKKVLAYAAEEANRENQFWIDSDHLLRGLLRFSNEATNSLERMNIQLDAARVASASDRAAISCLEGAEGSETSSSCAKELVLRNFDSGLPAYLLIPEVPGLISSEQAAKENGKSSQHFPLVAMRA